MRKFNDENGLEEILGCIYVAQGWPEFCEEIKIKKLLDEIVARIREKLARNKNPTRHNWFTLAIECVIEAQARFALNDLEGGQSLLKKAEDYLASGNKAHKRRAAFLIAPDGVIHPKKR